LLLLLCPSQRDRDYHGVRREGRRRRRTDRAGGHRALRRVAKESLLPSAPRPPPPPLRHSLLLRRRQPRTIGAYLPDPRRRGRRPPPHLARHPPRPHGRFLSARRRAG
ncbi:unnamed protein product, partial [Musa acuminata subsp. burmannicoides]